MPQIETLAAPVIERDLGQLADLLRACVHAGASVGYILPFGPEEAARFWREGVFPALDVGRRLVLVTREGDRISGAVQLDIDTPPNQPHRAEAKKLLVHPDFRRRGLARALMVELERQAKALGRSLITLDTRTGDVAEPLYASLGYATAGTIPGYCLDPSRGAFDATTIMYKAL